MSIKKDIRKLFSEYKTRKSKQKPFVLLEVGADPRITPAAKEILSDSGVDPEEYIHHIEHLAKHVSKMSLSGVETVFIKVPGNKESFLVYFTPSCAKKREECGLTRREREIINCLVTGTTNREIARSLNISMGTVKTHLDNIYVKLGVSNRLEAALAGIMGGMVCPCDSEESIFAYRTAPYSCPIVHFIMHKELE